MEGEEIDSESAACPSKGSLAGKTWLLREGPLILDGQESVVFTHIIWIFPQELDRIPPQKKTDEGEFVLELQMISQHQENKFMKGMNSQKGTGNRKLERAPVLGRRQETQPGARPGIKEECPG